MSKWVDTLKQAKSSLVALQTMSAEPNPDRPLHARLIGDLYHISSQLSGAKVLFNFQMAAIGLYFMLDGRRASNSLVRAFIYFQFMIYIVFL